MGPVRTLVVCAAALAMSGTIARAADMPGYPPEPLPFPTHVTPAPAEQLASGWYLRGDLGYRWQRFSSASDLVNDYTSSKMTDPFVAGLGAGYKFKWFRFDVTGDYGVAQHVHRHRRQWQFRQRQDRHLYGHVQRLHRSRHLGGLHALCRGRHRQGAHGNP